MKKLIYAVAFASFLTPVAIADGAKEKVKAEAVVESAADKKAKEREAWLKQEKCKRHSTTGSRVKTTKTCMTNAEWKELAEANNKALRDLGRVARENEGG